MTKGYTNEELVETLLALANSISQTQRFGDTADKLSEAAKRIAEWDKKEQRERADLLDSIRYACRMMEKRNTGKKKMWERPKVEKALPFYHSKPFSPVVPDPILTWIIDEW